MGLCVLTAHPYASGGELCQRSGTSTTRKPSGSSTVSPCSDAVGAVVVTEAPDLEKPDAVAVEGDERVHARRVPGYADLHVEPAGRITRSLPIASSRGTR